MRNIIPYSREGWLAKYLYGRRENYTNKPTWQLCRLASTAFHEIHVCGIRAALKQRRLDALKEIEEIDRAEAQITQNLQHRRKRLRRLK